MKVESKKEEFYNALSHAFGAVLGCIGLIFLIIIESQKTEYSLLSVIIYGLSIIILFSVSAIYHYSTKEKQKSRYRILDHISIYILIAGTYTPIALISLENSLGWLLFYIVWGIAAFGVVLKVFFTGRFEAFSVILYLVMGWLVIFDFSNLSQVIGSNGILLLFAGGLAYTGGIIFYAIEKIPYNHVIWHLFVLAGAIFHYFLVLFYVV